jgi:hypothetical protein
MKRQQVIAVVAGLSTLWVGTLFLGLQFDRIEDAVMTSTADAETLRTFAALNVPLHASFAAIYVTSLFLLLLVPLRVRRDC